MLWDAMLYVQKKNPPFEDEKLWVVLTGLERDQAARKCINDEYMALSAGALSEFDCCAQMHVSQLRGAGSNWRKI